MNDYDFSTLNDKEFENISIDLISKDKEKRFERFKAGKDGGIDGRFYCTDNKQEIIQCKHYLKTGINGLFSSLKKKNDKGINEIEKVKKLNPSKYIFATSLQLSVNNKKEIKKLFSPYIISDNDIYGQEDLNVILSNNSDIEEKYYKLWINSATVLDRIMNNAIKGRSEHLIEDIKEKSKYYVITDNHNKAIQILEKTNIIIIAGEPGIGKTTLAKNLAIFYIEKEFECFDIENSINEAENIFKKDKKQIFYFDDFLGSNYLEALENKKDSHIIKFIERVKRDKTKKFILTSRTSIFNQSISLSDTFKSKNIDEDEFIISIESLKEMDKAYIFYNYIWHSSLEENYIDELYKDKRYKDIIRHKNFSPRIIEFITDTVKIKKENIKPIHYWKYLIEKLDNPQDIWENTFDKQSDDFMRAIVVLTVFNGNIIEESKLEKAYNTYVELENIKNNSNNSKEFSSVIKEVVRYFLNKRHNVSRNIDEYTLFNPSIADFILNRYNNNTKKLLNYYLSLQTIDSLKELHSKKSYGKIDINDYENILIGLHKKMNIDDLNHIDYNIELLYIIELHKFNSSIDVYKRNLFLQNLINTPQNFNLIDEFVSIICYTEWEDLSIQNYDFIFLLLKNMNIDEEYINKMVELLEFFDIDDKLIHKELNELANECIVMKLDGYMSDISVDDVGFSVTKDEDEDEDYGLIVDDDDIKKHLHLGLHEVKNNITPFSGFIVDDKKIFNKIDIESISQKLVEKHLDIDEGYDYRDDTSSYRIDNIEDLFER